MIITDPLRPHLSIADQLDDLVLESFGAADLVFAETGCSTSGILAASAWCHTLVRRTPATALADLSELASGRIRIVRRGRGSDLHECIINDESSDGLSEQLFNADIVVVDGANECLQHAMPALVHFFARCAAGRTLTIVPIRTAASFIRHPLLRHLQVLSDELISTDVVSDQRAALIAASFMHQTKGSTS